VACFDWGRSDTVLDVVSSLTLSARDGEHAVDARERRPVNSGCNLLIVNV
jgi:hypothetical protein